MPKTQYLILASSVEQTCGVEEFARLTAAKLKDRGKTHKLDRKVTALVKALAKIDSVIFNFPIVAWKRKLVEPIIAACVSRLLGKSITVILHEWDALDWKRRLVIAPVLAFSHKILFSAPEVSREFDQSSLSRLSTRDRNIIPVPPNIVPAASIAETEHSDALARQRRAGRLIIGQFGSIYPKKQSTAVLEVAARLLAAGHDVGVVFAGSFIKGTDNVEENFFAEARRLGISDRVLVTGYIASSSQLYGILREVDVFCYLFSEGLTARRASVIAASFAGKPVVANAPRRANALAHHDLYRALIECGIVRIVDSDASIEMTANAILEARMAKIPPFDARTKIADLWTTVLAALDETASLTLPIR